MTTTIPQSARLEGLLISSPDMEKKVRSIIQKELAKARSALAKDAKAAVPNDPRQAYKSVRRGIYKRVLGGNLNILAQKKAGAPHAYTKRRKPRPVTDKNGQHRGGNCSPRSARTEQVDGYWGKDRGFILRFVNDGADRTDPSKQEKRGNRALTSRGRIGAKNWFPGASHKELEAAAERIAQLIDEEIKKATK